MVRAMLGVSRMDKIRNEVIDVVRRANTLGWPQVSVEDLITDEEKERRLLGVNGRWRSGELEHVGGGLCPVVDSDSLMMMIRCHMIKKCFYFTNFHIQIRYIDLKMQHIKMLLFTYDIYVVTVTLIEYYTGAKTPYFPIYICHNIPLHRLKT